MRARFVLGVPMTHGSSIRSVAPGNTIIGVKKGVHSDISLCKPGNFRPELLDKLHPRTCARTAARHTRTVTEHLRRFLTAHQVQLILLDRPTYPTPKIRGTASTRTTIANSPCMYARRIPPKLFRGYMRLVKLAIQYRNWASFDIL